MSDTIQFYQDKPHSCSYLEKQQAQNIYPDPHLPMSNGLYSRLIQIGFRRSGDFSYRPYCPNCSACVPVRINVSQFKPNRTQRRCLKKNSDLTISVHLPEFNQEHFALYERYLKMRHQGGGMDNPTKESYMSFLKSDWSDTGFIEFRHESELVAVAVTDFVADGASAFYTFFDPDFEKRSLGTFAILSQLKIAKQHGLPYLYLGYWIESCKKMVYKQQFSGLEGLVEQEWLSFTEIKTFE
jgi:arginine-tRNA-protein transferase